MVGRRGFGREGVREGSAAAPVVVTTDLVTSPCSVDVIARRGRRQPCATQIEGLRCRPQQIRSLDLCRRRNRSPALNGSILRLRRCVCLIAVGVRTRLQQPAVDELAEIGVVELAALHQARVRLVGKVRLGDGEVEASAPGCILLISRKPSRPPPARAFRPRYVPRRDRRTRSAGLGTAESRTVCDTTCSGACRSTVEPDAANVVPRSV